MTYITGAQLFDNLNSRVDISVPTIAARDTILTFRRRWGMLVSVYDDGANSGIYILNKNNNTLGDNTNWAKFETGGDHNSLPNIQGGNATERYHLSAGQHTTLSKITEAEGLPQWDGDEWPGGGGAGGHTLQTPAGDDLEARAKLRAKAGLRLLNEAGVDFTSLVLDTLIKLGVVTDSGTVRTIQAEGSESNIDIALEPKGSGVVKSTKWAGTGERILTADADGKSKSDTEIVIAPIDVTVDDSSGRNLVDDEWTSNYFPRDGIPGQFGSNGEWNYQCTSNGWWTRLPIARKVVKFYIDDIDVIVSLTNTANWDSNNRYTETDTTVLTKLAASGPVYYSDDYIFFNTPNSLYKAKRISA